MKRMPKSLLATAAAFVLFSVAPGAGAADSLRMRYGLKPGTAYDQTFTLNFGMAFDPSTPAALLSLLQSFAGEVKQQVEMKARLETTSGAGDGSLPFTYKVVEAHGSVTHSGQTKPIGSLAEAAAKPPANGSVAADRRRIALAAAADPKDASQNRVADRLAESLPVLPDKDLAPGQSFETVTTLALPGPSGKERRTEAKWIYTLKSLDAKEAVFDVVQKIPEAAQLQIGQDKSAAMSGGGTGRAVWNRAEGTFTSLHIDTDMTIDFDLPLPAGLTLGGSGNSAGQPGGASGSPAPTKVRTRVTGPLEMTLSRAGTLPAPTK
jgi:hypothetical protein